jgi:protocatechuate 3,4-dioxygenase beta subunit
MADHTRPRAVPLMSRRDAIAWLGTAGLAILGAGCGSGAPGTAAPSARTSRAAGSPLPQGAAACVLTPELTEGPYYIPGEAVRGDITEGRPGVPLRLEIGVVEAENCTPVPGAMVEVWHADAGGAYSGFGAASSNRTFLRGVQVTSAGGVSRFTTIYPGWYQGRAVHIHLKVRRGEGAVHTGQLFFEERITDAVHGKPPYSGHAGRRRANTEDSIFADGGPESLLRLSPDGNGYLGGITIGLRSA